MFLLFYYFYLNSSQEALFFFDYMRLNFDFLIPLNLSYMNLFFLSLSIYFALLLVFQVNFSVKTQQYIFIFYITSTISIMLYVESYQLYYLFCMYAGCGFELDVGNSI